MKNFKRTTSNISAVIRSDIRRLSRSVVTVVCVFGLALVPCLYAWFNIMSNWDPYTPDSTQNLKIAVASSDAGTDFVGMKLNVGDIILDKLKANDQIDWQFPDSVQGVMDGLYAGDYYAGLIIPEDFSASILGFTDGEMDQPEIIYYDNQKMNAVASRVTDRAQSLVRDEINAIFVSTIVDELSTFTSVFNGMGLSAEDALANRRKLAHAHLKRAVAADGNNLPAGLRDRRTKSGRDRIPHCAEAAACEESAFPLGEIDRRPDR